MKENNTRILYLTSKHQICFDESQWYIDSEPQSIDKAEGSGISPEDKAREKCSSLASIEIGRLLTHFPNIAVLAAAGTSMDNDIHTLCYFMVERKVIRLSSISSAEGIS